MFLIHMWPWNEVKVIQLGLNLSRQTHTHAHTHTHHTHLECIFSLWPRIDTCIPSWNAVICLPQSGPRTSQLSQKSFRWSVKQFQVNTITPWTSNATLTWTLNQPLDLRSSLECSDPDKLWLITLSLLAPYCLQRVRWGWSKISVVFRVPCQDCFQLAYSNLHDRTNSVTEILSQLRCNCGQRTAPA